MIDWKRKLTSRKLWAAVAGFVGGLLVALGVDKTETTQITGLIMSGASVIAYIIGEGMADAANAGNIWVEDDPPSAEEDDHE